MNEILRIIAKQINSITAGYSKSSTWAKIFILTLLLLLVIVYFKSLNHPSSSDSLKEGFERFEQHNKFLFKTGYEVYDNFYADVYDYLVYNSQKDDYEVGEIITKTTPNKQSKILDVGSGTGHHVAAFSALKHDIVGIDISESMVEKARQNFPNYNFLVADALNGNAFEQGVFTHIVCLYFTMYYFKNKRLFFENAMKWLMPGGYLIIHLVNRDKFDPILPPGNPLLFGTPQKYAKTRITNTNLVFDTFDYNANFDLDKQKNIAKFTEKFKSKENGKSRKNEHIMYMESQDSILNDAQDVGFILDAQIDMMQCAYDYQYLYILIKPS
jgi:SAM-dependent methyltransferase